MNTYTKQNEQWRKIPKKDGKNLLSCYSIVSVNQKRTNIFKNCSLILPVAFLKFLNLKCSFLN